MEDSEAITEGEDTEDNQNVLAQINQDVQKEFNRLWGWTDLAMNVSKEIGTPYLQCIELPALYVLTLANYLTDKVKLLESKYKTSK